MSTVVSVDRLVDKLQKAGVPLALYARNPLGNGYFAARVSGNQIRMWITQTPDVKIRVSTSKRHRQATISIQEPARKPVITRERKMDIRLNNLTPVPGRAGLPTRDAVRQWVDDRVMNFAEPLALPHTIEDGDYSLDVEWEYDLDRAYEEIKDRYERWERTPEGERPIGFEYRAPNRYEIPVTIRYHYDLPKSSIDLLIGIDEKAPFICALPKTPKNVAHAHEILRPRRVPKGSPRQGEFFFVPVSKKLEAQLTRILVDKDQGDAAMPLRGPTGLATDHFAQFMQSLNGKWYAFGTIQQDTRRRHEPLRLYSWHEVVPNNEVVLPASIEISNGGYWD